jgi:hypothetical protein
VSEAASACGDKCGGGGCGGVDFSGECQGNVATWCDDGLQSIDCGKAGLTCGYDDSTGLYDCL